MRQRRDAVIPPYTVGAGRGVWPFPLRARILRNMLIYIILFERGTGRIR
jgi:hypothetical protein